MSALRKGRRRGKAPSKRAIRTSAKRREWLAMVANWSHPAWTRYVVPTTLFPFRMRGWSGPLTVTEFDAAVRAGLLVVKAS